MTTIEAVNLPISYKKEKGEVLIGTGKIIVDKWDIPFSYPIFYFFNKSSTKQIFDEIWVHSLNSSKPGRIARFKVKKLHDTR